MILYKNAEFITCEPENKVFKAMAVDKGRISWIGTSRPLPCPSPERWIWAARR